jgi:AraC-like DNA-binding protein
MQGLPGSMSMNLDRSQPSQHAVHEPQCLVVIRRLSAKDPRKRSSAGLFAVVPHAAQLNEHIVVKYLAHSAKEDIVNRVKAAIIDALANGAVSEISVATGLHTTPRNLHRKLQKEQTSFKVLLTDVRRELARQYIQDRSKTLTEISYLLGFSEVSSFSRAYKGWTGHPPSEARQEVA